MQTPPDPATSRLQCSDRMRQQLRSQCKSASIVPVVITKGTGTEVSNQFPDVTYDQLSDKQIVAEIERVRATIKRYNEDLNDIMARNHEYLYKKELNSQNAKVESVDTVLKALELMKENNAKTLQSC